MLMAAFWRDKPNITLSPIQSQANDGLSTPWFKRITAIESVGSGALATEVSAVLKSKVATSVSDVQRNILYYRRNFKKGEGRN